VLLAVAIPGCAPAPATVEKPAVPDKPAADKPAVKPMLYTPLDKDNALHNTAGMIYEWWYLDAAFDNGYSTSFSWQVVTQDFIGKDRPTRLVQFAIYDPSGKKTSVDAGFKPEEVTVSADICNVKMGDNQLKGSYPKWDVSFRQGDLGAQLTFESLAEGFKTPPDGVVYFSRQPEKYIGWVIAQPRAKVTGKLILNGKEIPVSGVGYHDHNWGNCSLKEMYNYWYWGRMYLPEYTFVYSVGQMVDALGKKPSSVIFAFKGPKLLEVSTEITVDASDFVLDPFTGAKYPRSVVLHPSGKAISGTVTHKLRNLVEALPPWGAQPGDGHAYFRFLSDCDIDLVAAGDKIQVKTPLIHEFMIP
jgi:hypothetical protein